MFHPALSHKHARHPAWTSEILLWCFTSQTQLPLSEISTSSVQWTAVLCSDFILIWLETFSRQISGQWDSPCKLSFPHLQHGCPASCLSLRNFTSWILPSCIGHGGSASLDLTPATHILEYKFSCVIRMWKSFELYASKSVYIFFKALYVCPLSSLFIFFNLISEILNSSEIPCCYQPPPMPTQMFCFLTPQFVHLKMAGWHPLNAMIPCKYVCPT